MKKPRAKKVAKKPVKKDKKLIPKEEFLSDELLKRLSRDGYCFDLSHEQALAEDRERTDALRKEIDDLKAKWKADTEKAAKDLENEVRDRAERLFELSGEKEKLEAELAEARATIEKMKADTDVAKTEAIKQLKSDGKCFNIDHMAADGKKGGIITALRMVAFGRRIMTRAGQFDMAEKFLIFYPPSMAEEFRKSIDDEDKLTVESLNKLMDVAVKEAAKTRGMMK